MLSYQLRSKSLYLSKIFGSHYLALLFIAVESKPSSLFSDKKSI